MISLVAQQRRSGLNSLRFFAVSMAGDAVLDELFSKPLKVPRPILSSVCIRLANLLSGLARPDAVESRCVTVTFRSLLSIDSR